MIQFSFIELLSAKLIRKDVWSYINKFQFGVLLSVESLSICCWSHLDLHKASALFLYLPHVLLASDLGYGNWAIVCLHGFMEFASATFGDLKFLSLNRLEEEAFWNTVFCLKFFHFIDSQSQNIKDIFPFSLGHIFLCLCNLGDWSPRQLFIYEGVLTARKGDKYSLSPR